MGELSAWLDRAIAKWQSLRYPCPASPAASGRLTGTDRRRHRPQRLRNGKTCHPRRGSAGSQAARPGAGSPRGGPPRLRNGNSWVWTAPREGCKRGCRGADPVARRGPGGDSGAEMVSIGSRSASCGVRLAAGRGELAGVRAPEPAFAPVIHVTSGVAARRNRDASFRLGTCTRGCARSCAGRVPVPAPGAYGPCAGRRPRILRREPCGPAPCARCDPASRCDPA